MSVLESHVGTGSVDPRWKDLYRIGGIASIAFPVMILLAIVAYFIWPYTPGFTSLENIYELLSNKPLEGLMSLDLMMVLMEPILILHLLALYVALKQVNESYALIALTLGLIGNVLILPARPLTEMVYLSDQLCAHAAQHDFQQRDGLSWDRTICPWSRILDPRNRSDTIAHSDLWRRVLVSHASSTIHPIGMGGSIHSSRPVITQERPIFDRNTRVWA